MNSLTVQELKEKFYRLFTKKPKDLRQWQRMYYPVDAYDIISIGKEEKISEEEQILKIIKHSLIKWLGVLNIPEGYIFSSNTIRDIIPTQINRIFSFGSGNCSLCNYSDDCISPKEGIADRCKYCPITKYRKKDCITDYTQSSKGNPLPMINLLLDTYLYFGGKEENINNAVS